MAFRINDLMTDVLPIVRVCPNSSDCGLPSPNIGDDEKEEPRREPEEPPEPGPDCTDQSPPTPPDNALLGAHGLDLLRQQLRETLEN
ncbi:MAG TPA: hypothetical protein VHR45_05905 [Thermoanaerobaculia bacterium]|nr:hypothetical protein [Thermoanaerobaculia bacterium]